MAARCVTDYWGLSKSIFRPAKAKRQFKGFTGNSDGVSVSPRGAIHMAMVAYLFARCRNAGVDAKGTIPKTVKKLIGQPVADSIAWEWALQEFLKAHPEYRGEEHAEIIRQAEWRIRNLREAENNYIKRLQSEREAAELRQQINADRRANPPLPADEELFQRKWKALRYSVLAASNGKCALCGRSMREHGVALEVDHIKPRSRFPKLALVKSNLQVLCQDCNRGKSNRDTTDWRPVKAVA